MKKTFLRYVRHLLLIGMITLSLAAGLAGLTVKNAHAATRVASDSCYGASCYGQDPVTFGCLDSYVISPDNKPEYYGGIIVGSFSTVYSYTCNAYWNQATLDAFAINQGFRVRTGISTIDSLGNSETTCYPVDCYPASSDNSYGGETGWPTYSNMVDGSGDAVSTFTLAFPDSSVINIDSVYVQNPNSMG